jgi:hypothetical protein
LVASLPNQAEDEAAGDKGGTAGAKARAGSGGQEVARASRSRDGREFGLLQNILHAAAQALLRSLAQVVQDVRRRSHRMNGIGRVAEQ